jgi:hypothetical protein
LERSFIVNTVNEALELGLKVMILKKSSKRELCMMGMKIRHRVKIIPKGDMWLIER